MEHFKNWIYYDNELGRENTSFEFKKYIYIENREDLKQAYCYMAARGAYKLYINNRPADDDVLSPGWTSVKRAEFQRYDITPLLRGGRNTISIITANGFMLSKCESKFLDEEGGRPKENIPFIPKHISINGSIQLTYLDDRVEEIFTDQTFEIFTTKIQYSDIYDGEIQDLTHEKVFLANARIDDSISPTIDCLSQTKIIEHERRKPVSYIETPKGEKVIDFGQNIAGYVEVRVKGKTGDRVRISHAEILDKDGNFYTENLREAKQEATYILSGENDILKPMFTYQGFRYIRIDEWPEGREINLDDFTQIALYSNMRRTGFFESGSDKLNRLYQNIISSQESNFLSVPTDCPQRNERYGWTGDIAAFIRCATMNFDVKEFMNKWLRDMIEDQGADGSIPSIIPSPFTGMISSAWGDAATICPVEVYRAYGDEIELKRQYPMMKKWVQYIQKHTKMKNLWVGGMHYGDWLGLDGGSSITGATQIDYIASAYYIKSLENVERAAMWLKKESDIMKYDKLLREAKMSFRNSFIRNYEPIIEYKGEGETKDSSFKNPLTTDDRIIRNNTQTGFALALKFNLCLDSDREKMAEKLASTVRKAGRIETGFVGTQFILHALSENGYEKLAYDMLLREEYPSWLYEVNMGATTIWERWNSLEEDGSVSDSGMNSFNHYAYGAVYSWIFDEALGIRQTPESVAYSSIVISPKPDKRLGFMKGGIETENGRISVSWKWNKDHFEYEIEVPRKTKCLVKINGMEQMIEKAGKYSF